MELQDVISKRRTVRSFSEKPVAKEMYLDAKIISQEEVFIEEKVHINTW